MRIKPKNCHLKLGMVAHDDHDVSAQEAEIGRIKV
jgi:hypothetical protein